MVITVDRADARRRYGESFMAFIMRDKTHVTITEEQDKALRNYHMMKIGSLIPYQYPIIYVVEAESGACKIGQTFSIKRRIRAYDTGHPSRVFLRHIELLNGAPITKCERAVHAELADVRLTGEWFSTSADTAISCVREKAENLGGSISLSKAWDESSKMEPAYRQARNGDPVEIRKMTDAKDALRWAIDRLASDMA